MPTPNIPEINKPPGRYLWRKIFWASFHLLLILVCAWPPKIAWFGIIINAICIAFHLIDFIRHYLAVRVIEKIYKRLVILKKAIETPIMSKDEATNTIFFQWVGYHHPEKGDILKGG